MADETTAEQAPAAPSPTTISMSEGEAQAVAALQHLAAWLSAEEARLTHELAYVRDAAAHARSGLHLHLARTFGVDAAHDPLHIDLATRTITHTSTTQQPQ